MSEGLNARKIEALALVNPCLRRMLDALTAATYEQFVDGLYRHLEDVIKFLELNRELRHKDDEDRLTVEIAGQLKQCAYQVTHNEKVGGHADLVVRSACNDSWLWVGEAKWHSSYDYLLQGYHQLTTRYLPGTTNRNKGGMLIYLNVRDGYAKEVIRQWRSKLIEEYPATKFEESESCNDLEFLSTQDHQDTGVPCTVRHMAICLKHAPLA